MSNQRAKTGRKWRNSNSTPGQFKSNREEIIRQLYIGLTEWEKDKAPEQIAELVAAHIDKYHGQNPKLIAMQDPHATDVDAHGAWRERGRTNIGSGNGIKIVCPSPQNRCKICQENERHTNHNGGHKFDPVVIFFYDTVYDIRFTVPDTAAARKAWQEDHPADENGKRYWTHDYKDYEKYGAIL